VRRFAGVLALVAVACGGGGAGIPQSQIETAVRQAECSANFRCGITPSIDACVSSRPSHATRWLASVTAGRKAYDPVAAKALVDWVTALPCGLTAASDSVSLRVGRAHYEAAFRGVVSKGGACGENEDCVAGMACLPRGGGAECDSVCTVVPAPSPVGASCALPMPPSGAVVLVTYPLCVDGATCDETDPANVVCRPLPTAGMACAGPVAGCGPGLICVTSDAHPDGVCEVLAKPGQGCDPASSTPCDDETTFCDPTSKICAPRPAVGATCDPLDPTSCRIYDACDGTTNTCVPLGLAGASCAPPAFPSCLGELVCVSMSTCQLEPAFSVCPN
jgi:hypothetical protein